jgi:hypothetical protein
MFCRFHPPGQATASKTVYENGPPNSTHRAQALLFHNRKFSPARSCFRLTGTLAQTGRLGGKRGKRGKRWKRWKMRILPIRRKGHGQAWQQFHQDSRANFAGLNIHTGRIRTTTQSALSEFARHARLDTVRVIAPMKILPTSSCPRMVPTEPS